MKTDRVDDARWNSLARALQREVPYVPRPFAELGRCAELSEDEALSRLRTWSDEGKLREISAVLEGEALGHDSALVAGRVAEDELDRVATFVSAHPTVTHCYRREHDLNLWFTLAVPEHVGLERTLDVLEDGCGGVRFHALRRTATFKIGVRFDLGTLRNETRVELPRRIERFRPSEREMELFRALQRPLPLVRRPFAELGRDAGLSESELLDFGRTHLGGAIRRHVGTFRHRRLGVSANGMVVWKAATEQALSCGPLLAAAPEVSHCYARTSIPEFPYSLYSMIHGPDEASVHAIAARLAQETGLDEHVVLFSRREYKKVRLRYFLPELDRWNAEHGVLEASHAP